MAGENYRRVVPTFWSDPDVKRKLTRDQKLLLLYFCTSPHSTMIGLYYCPLAYAANEADLPVEDIRRALAGPLATFVTYDEETEEIFVHALAKHNVGDELTATGKNGRPDHRIAGIQKLLEAVHSPRLRRAFLARYAAAYQLTMPLPEQREAPSEPLASPLVSPSEAIAVHNITKHSITPRQKPARKPKPDGPPLPEGYLEECCQLWETHRGKPNWGRIGAAQKHLIPDHGPRQVLLVWAGYLEDRRGKDFCAPEDFVTNYEHYRRKWGVEIAEDGTEIPVPDEPLAVGAA